MARVNIMHNLNLPFLHGKTLWPACLLLALFFFAFCISALDTWHFGFGWHDQQRVYQLLLLVISALLVLLVPQSSLPRIALGGLVFVLALGLLSSLAAAYPGWALKEWARYAGLVVAVLLLAGLARELPCTQDIVLWAMACVGGLHAYQFLVYYLMAFLTGIRMLNADILFNGFANPRFFAQFQVLLLPVLGLLANHCWQKQRRKLAGVLLVVLLVQWCIAYSLGGRGLWLGLAASHMALLFIDWRHWRGVVLQALAALMGLVIFIILFKWIPLWLGLVPQLRDGLRTSLSGREHIWLQAWDMALSNPWLGVGPMHYSATYNPIAAHPHQVVLQWLSEWGFPATVMVVLMGAWGVWHGAKALRRQESTSADAGIWMAIFGALVLAQVDGVFVMPYTETWLAMLIGLALARWSRPLPAGKAQRLFVGGLALAVVLVLGRILLLEVPILPEVQEAYLAEHSGWKPRFWSQGWIPMGN